MKVFSMSQRIYYKDLEPDAELIIKKDFNKWNELLFWNKWKLKRLKKQPAEKSMATDSISPKMSRPEVQSKRERPQ